MTIDNLKTNLFRIYLLLFRNLGRITGPPKEPAIIMNALLGNSPSNKLDTFDDFDNGKGLNNKQQLVLSSSINCQNPPNSSILSDWGDSPNLSLFTQQQTNTSIIQNNQGPGTIGMERRQNRNSNGNSYLSGDSGIYSSASDMTISSPILQQQILGTPEAYMVYKFKKFVFIKIERFKTRFGISEAYGSAFRSPTTLESGQQQFDAGGLMFSENYFGNSNQSKIWSAVFIFKFSSKLL
jgi:hypothetical protein